MTDFVKIYLGTLIATWKAMAGCLPISIGRNK
jgi:hypothetical protein